MTVEASLATEVPCVSLSSSGSGPNFPLRTFNSLILWTVHCVLLHFPVLW